MSNRTRIKLLRRCRRICEDQLERNITAHQDSGLMLQPNSMAFLESFCLYRHNAPAMAVGTDLERSVALLRDSWHWLSTQIPHALSVRIENKETHAEIMTMAAQYPFQVAMIENAFWIYDSYTTFEKEYIELEKELREYEDLLILERDRGN